MKQSFSDQFRAAVRNAPESRYKIAKATGVSESILSRFVRGDAGLSMKYMDLIAEHLGIQLVVKGKRKPQQPKRPTKPKSKGG